MSLASASAAAIEPDPSDEAMADLGGVMPIAHAAAANAASTHLRMWWPMEIYILPELFGNMNSSQRKNYFKRRNKIRKGRGDFRVGLTYLGDFI